MNLRAQVAQLRAQIKASGLSINAYAKTLQVPKGVSSRTLRRWLAGTSPIPPQVFKTPRP